ncbi:MAG: bifunctional 5,10-methylenetetrahydrofolate dehydrogenase/5,10-methenyltetrahydrofolate cyclohydrolase [Bacteroidales bacterium]|jgi:methylenetetrahydrofolate dehydrogenase (NADP+)/methenyltetrahydrofolate cyclohydrolase|nr:bifunctional 5,10-methylenetetrahydrofolate dehydrogenase/5,10-methenyltetrahydrofolate cyclohydrolase [Bacteroidales bacterium]
MNIISGTALAKEIKTGLAADISAMTAQRGRAPKIALVLVGEDPASASYVRNKGKTSTELGIESDTHHLPEAVTQEALIATIDELNQDVTVDAILVQLPLPQHIDTEKILNAIDYRKDVDGLHPINVGKFSCGEKAILPCTPRGILSLLRYGHVEIAGRHAVVVGRSNLVGKPVAQLLLRENATVTLCHTQSRNLADMVRQADILVLAMGCPGAVTPDMLKQGVTVVDVAINYMDNKLCGDLYMACHMPDLEARAAAITPVPGGVGPMTITSLMQNVFEIYLERN